MYAVPLARKANKTTPIVSPDKFLLGGLGAMNRSGPMWTPSKSSFTGKALRDRYVEQHYSRPSRKSIFEGVCPHLRRANRRRHLTGRGYDIIDRSDKFRNDSRVGGCRVSDCSRSTARFFRHVPFFSEGSERLAERRWLFPFAFRAIPDRYGWGDRELNAAHEADR